MDGFETFGRDEAESKERAVSAALDASARRGVLRNALARGGAPQVLAAGGVWVNGVWTRYERIGDPVGQYPIAP